MGTYPVDDKAIEAAMAISHSPAEDATAPCDLICRPCISGAIARFLDAEGAECFVFHCNCDNGSIEEGPPGATYSITCPRCKGSGELSRIVIEHPFAGERRSKTT